MAEVANPKFLRPVVAPDIDRGQAITFSAPLTLDAGRELSPLTVAYMTYGTLNAATTLPVGSMIGAAKAWMLGTYSPWSSAQP